MVKQYRQGDIFFEEVNEIPVTATPRVNGNMVIAHGEVTGHSHRGAEAGTLMFDDVDPILGDIVYCLNNEVDAPIIHDEHGVIPLPVKRPHRSYRQRQYNPIAKMREIKVRD